MSDQTQKNIQIMRQWFDTLNKGDYAQVMKAADELCTEDYCLHDPDPIKCTQGKKVYLAGFDEWWRGISGFHAVIEDIFGAGDKTATRAIVECIDNKKQKKRKTESIFISRFENGKIAEEWNVTASVS